MKRALRRLRSIFFWSAQVLVIVFLAVWFSLLSLLRIRSRRIRRWTVRIFAWLLLLIAGVRYEVRGLENLPREGVFIMAANHPGFVDYLIPYLYLPFEFRYVLSYTFFHVPLLTKVVAELGYIPLGEGEENRQKGSDPLSGLKIVQTLKSGVPLFVFPEGQRKKGPGENIARFRHWVARAAMATGVPLVPIAVKGSEKILPKMQFDLSPGRVLISFGRPFSFAEGLSDFMATAELQAKIDQLYNQL